MLEHMISKGKAVLVSATEKGVHGFAHIKKHCKIQDSYLVKNYTTLRLD